MIEIERKFLVRDLSVCNGLSGTKISQAYLNRSDKASVRVRLKGDAAFLTIKSEATDLSRYEFEYPVPVEEAEVMMAKLCDRAPITKSRYEIGHGGLLWEVDFFEGVNAGLAIAEVELSHRDEEVALPSWAGPEVTSDARFRNSALYECPFSTWDVDYASLLLDPEAGLTVSLRALG